MPSNAVDRIPNLTGKIIGDGYQLLELIGSGAGGVVYKAIHLPTARSSQPIFRAVKVMQKAGLSKRELAAVNQEIQFHLTCADQPGVVTIYDVCDNKAYFYLVLDLCDGGDLFGRICDLRAYEGNETLVRTAFLSLLNAVSGIHSRGIAHRDLKPENVLVNHDGSRLFLSDFGLATDATKISIYGWGTGIYMSPEATGKLNGRVPYCPRTSDVWALGIILVNMITGRNPWMRARHDDPDFKAYVDDPESFMEALPVSRDIAGVLLRTLVIDPRCRISLANLRRAIADAPTLL
ncbi:kinase-like domain-containing protein, partial [Epithele typhae]|uniref:kinase-like domain-containing protein n=1 Tax=Epithele typhae TaxID=378194 RepID=UPI00200758BF